MKTLLILILLVNSVICNGQQKKCWIDNYWASANVSILLTASDYETNTKTIGTGFTIEAGRNLLKKYRVGLGYSLIQLNEIDKIKTYNIYIEKFIKDKSRELYFFAKPGIACVANANEMISKVNRFELNKSKAGFNFQVGTGIRWKIKRNSFNLGAGYHLIKYSIVSNEYPIAVDPYNPFEQPLIKHTYKFEKSRVVINIGISL
jgi:hypothetical protein